MICRYKEGKQSFGTEATSPKRLFPLITRLSKVFFFQSSSIPPNLYRPTATPCNKITIQLSPIPITQLVHHPRNGILLHPKDVAMKRQITNATFAQSMVIY
jgi:hypothetical protein